jgi:hypothetical protein
MLENLQKSRWSKAIDAGDPVWSFVDIGVLTASCIFRDVLARINQPSEVVKVNDEIELGLRSTGKKKDISRFKTGLANPWTRLDRSTRWTPLSGEGSGRAFGAFLSGARREGWCTYRTWQTAYCQAG